MTPDALLARLRPARARVDLLRLESNYRALSAFARIPLMPVLKADAYGHGAVMVARRLEAAGAPMLAVALVEEAVELRRAGIAVPLVVLCGFTSAQVPLLAEFDLTPVISTPSMVESFLTQVTTRIPVHVKVDTGMHRLGLPPEALGGACRQLADSGRADVQGLMTHLSSPDENGAVTNRQLDLFDAALDDVRRLGISPRHVHAANSGGLAFLRPTHTLARPGLLLYGVAPRPLAPNVAVEPVMQVSGDIEMLKPLPAGEPVSYGGRFVTARPSRIATISLGYADGVPRTDRMREHGQMSLRAQRRKVVGTICMDLTLLDVTDEPEACEGDEAVLFGDDPTAWDVADWAGTNAWDALTSVGPRVPRVYTEGDRILQVGSRFASLPEIIRP